jgi:hypothetical protein
MMAKKLTMTEKWMLDHPNDEPSPTERRAAMEWRHKRFYVSPERQAKQAKYEEARLMRQAATAPPATRGE